MTSTTPMYLSELEGAAAGMHGDVIRRMAHAGAPVPQIMRLMAYKPDRGEHIVRLAQAVLRGPSPLPPGQRELIAAFVSRRNNCVF